MSGQKIYQNFVSWLDKTWYRKNKIMGGQNGYLA